MRTTLKILIGFLVAVAGAAIFAVAAFRPPAVLVHQSVRSAGGTVPARADLDPIPGDPGSFTLRYVELDDDGYFAEREQLALLRTDLQTRMEETDTTVLLYVHGWNHNAAADNENVACFKQLARGAAIMQSKLRSANGLPRAVFAIYIGWPGLVYENRTINKALTYFGRQATADRIGDRGDLLQLFTEVARLRDAHREGGRGAKFVIVSHSLGARLTYRALRPIMQNAADQASEPQGQLADVAVLVNPALSAADHVSLSRLMSTTVPGVARGAPRFIVATSEQDEVLSGVFPLSQRVASFVRGDFRLGATSRTVAIGQYADYVTHRLDLSPPGAYTHGAGADGCPTLDHRELSIVRGIDRVTDAAELYAYQRVMHYGENGEADYETRLSTLPNKPPSPIMVVEVSGDVIPNHNDIFTSPFVDFVSRVINAGLYGPRT